MTWKGIAPIVHRVETIYDKGIKVLPTQLEQYHPFWQRSEALPKWDITIVPGRLVSYFLATPLLPI